MKVCWITNIPSPYKVDFMNLLGKEVELTVLFETHTEEGRDNSWYKEEYDNFKAIYVEGFDIGLLNRMAKENDVLINSDYSKPLCILATELFHMHGKKVLIQADGGLAVPRGLVDSVISFFMKRADGYLSSGKETNKYFGYYGVPENKCFTYPFTSLTESDLKNNREMRSDKELYKNKLYSEPFALLSVGQPIPRKGYDVLVKAMEGLPTDIGLYIVGGKPEDSVKELASGNAHIHFVDFMSKSELAEYYAGADLFVLPTRYDIWGLVINEAMSFGLPFVSTDGCVAAMEMNNLYDNGIICKIESVNELHDAILSLYNDRALLESKGKASMEASKNYSLEKMVEGYMKAINEICYH